MKKHVNPSKFLHDVYTEQGGVKEHNKNQQTIGVMKFAGVFFLLQKIRHIGDKIENMEIKADRKSRKESDTRC